MNHDEEVEREKDAVGEVHQPEQAGPRVGNHEDQQGRHDPPAAEELAQVQPAGVTKVSDYG
jgi:hypothetical protein